MASVLIRDHTVLSVIDKLMCCLQKFVLYQRSIFRCVLCFSAKQAARRTFATLRRPELLPQRRRLLFHRITPEKILRVSWLSTCIYSSGRSIHARLTLSRLEILRYSARARSSLVISLRQSTGAVELGFENLRFRFKTEKNLRSPV